MYKMTNKLIDMFMERLLCNKEHEKIAELRKKRSCFSKEVTESVSVIHVLHVMNHRNILKIKDIRNYVVVVSGDGKYPYTASLFKAFFNFSEIHCVDPRIQYDRLIDGVQSHKCGIEDFQQKFYTDKPVLLISVHGHVPITEFYKSIKTEKLFISLPCCSDYGIIKDQKPIFEYINEDVLSPKNKLLVYQN